MNQKIDTYFNSRGEALRFVAILMCKDYTDEQKEQVINAWNEDHIPKQIPNKATKSVLDIIYG